MTLVQSRSYPAGSGRVSDGTRRAGLTQEGGQGPGVIFVIVNRSLIGWIMV